MKSALEADQSLRPKSTNGRGLTLRPASFGDYDQIARLEARYGLGDRSYKEWSHLWLDNPLYQELQASWHIGWVLENHEPRIVGSIGNIPLLYELEGRRIVAASARSWVAEPEYRSASLLLLDQVINQPDVELYLNTTFATASQPCITLFQCERVPVGQWDRAAFWITQHRGFAKSVLRDRKLAPMKPLSVAVSAMASLKNILTSNLPRTADVEVRVCPGFDDHFDDFWVDLRGRHPHLLLAIRRREWLAWHYKYSLLANRVWIATVVDGPRLVAYAVFYRRDRPDIGLKRVRLVDFQSLDGSTALLPTLLAWALARCKREGIHMLESVGRWLEQGELIDIIAPYRRRLAIWKFYYRASAPELAERLRDRRTWAPSLFDGDASLML